MAKKRLSWLRSTPILFALLGAAVFGYLDFHAKHSSFSQKSLTALREMNEAYDMTVEDLFDHDDSVSIAQLTRADLFSAEPSDSNNKGLLVSLEKGNVLLFQPGEALEDTELKDIAERYLELIPEVKHVELDQDLQLFGEPVYDWTLAPEQTVQLSMEIPEERENIKVAVIDSGMDVNHPLFDNYEVLKGWNTFNNDENPYDDVGHGTHIAGIIAQNSEHVSLVPYKIASATGGRLSNVVEGLHHALEDEVDVMNMSFGLFSPSDSLEELIEEALDEGVIVVAAAGNESSDAGFYPATYDGTIAVASVDQLGSAMPRSNYGEWITLAANGSYVYSALPDNDYGYKTGTSQSAALVSARVASLLYDIQGRYDLSPENLVKALTRQSVLIPSGKLAGVPILE